MESFKQLLFQLHLSYLQARKSKRKSADQIRFEIEQERNLYALARSIHDRTYNPKPSLAFIINKPVTREIFAADFSDRVVHHLIYRCIYPFIDRKLINDTYSCRVGKGTMYGIKRVKHFMNSCSEDISKETYVLKLDIEAYFMSIKHDILLGKVVELLPPVKKSFLGIGRDTLLYLLEVTICNHVVDNCRMMGSIKDWDALPAKKSLFHYPSNTGLPIGNLTSQVFGNVYLNDFDHKVKSSFRIKYYGRYVDDMVFLHNDRLYLECLIPRITEQLSCVSLRLHPKKILLQSIDEGIPFLGHIIKPYRTYLGNRTKRNFYLAIQKINLLLSEEYHIGRKSMCDIRATLNSYLGHACHTNSFNLRKSMMANLIKRFHDFFYIDAQYRKIIINESFWQWHFSPSYQFTERATIC